MKRRRLLSTAVFAAALLTGSAVAADDPLVLNTRDLKWEKCGDPPWDVCQRAVLRGDREKEPSEHLMRFPKGFKFERHWHDNPENLIVTEGAMVIVFDGGQEQTVRPGGYVRIPAKAPHWGRCPDGCTFYLGLVGPDSYYDK
jgi:quercetin dioxygenase-like cupin family protein